MQIEVQAQREPECVWRDLEYFALLCRLRGVPVFPIALFPIVDVLGSGHGRRPRLGYERVVQREVVLGHTVLEFAFLAVTLRALDAARIWRSPTRWPGHSPRGCDQGPARRRASPNSPVCVVSLREAVHIATRRKSSWPTWWKPICP